MGVVKSALDLRSALMEFGGVLGSLILGFNFFFFLFRGFDELEIHSVHF